LRALRLGLGFARQITRREMRATNLNLLAARHKCIHDRFRARQPNRTAASTVDSYAVPVMRSNTRKAGISGLSRVSWEAGPKAGLRGWGGRNRTSEWRNQ